MRVPKVLFLSSMYVNALKAYGIELSQTSTVRAVKELFTEKDWQSIIIQTYRLRSYYPSLTEIGNIPGLPHPETKETDEVYSTDPADDQDAWDVFCSDGEVSKEDTLKRVSMLNCVITTDNEFILFEDENSSVPTMENVLSVYAARTRIENVLCSDIWKNFLTTC